MKNFTLILALLLWTFYVCGGIGAYYTNYNLEDWLFIIPFALWPYIALLISYLKKRKRKINKLESLTKSTKKKK